jgi:peptide deformylase
LLGTTRKCKRYQTIKVQRKTAEFQTRIKTFTGWTAQIIQHEIDHCNGVFYIKKKENINEIILKQVKEI